MKSQTMTALLTAILLTSFSLASADLVDRVRVVVPPQSGPTVNNIASLLARQITARCDAEVITSGEAELTINLAIEPGIGDEGFKIEGDTDGAIRIVGNDERGLLFGVGKFLRASRYDRGGFTPGTWRGTSIPKCPVRAIYLATHYRNFYEAASLEEVGQYIESLGLWGYNTVIIHYPTWQFTGISDPAAREWLERSKKLFPRDQGSRLVGWIAPGLG